MNCSISEFLGWLEIRVKILLGIRTAYCATVLKLSQLGLLLDQSKARVGTYKLHWLAGIELHPIHIPCERFDYLSQMQ